MAWEQTYAVCGHSVKYCAMWVIRFCNECCSYLTLWLIPTFIGLLKLVSYGLNCFLESGNSGDFCLLTWPEATALRQEPVGSFSALNTNAHSCILAAVIRNRNRQTCLACHPLSRVSVCPQPALRSVHSVSRPHPLMFGCADNYLMPLHPLADSSVLAVDGPEGVLAVACKLQCSVLDPQVVPPHHPALHKLVHRADGRGVLCAIGVAAQQEGAPPRQPLAAEERRLLRKYLLRAQWLQPDGGALAATLRSLDIFESAMVRGPPDGDEAVFMDLQGVRYIAPTGADGEALTPAFVAVDSDTEQELMVSCLGVRRLRQAEFYKVGLGQGA